MKFNIDSAILYLGHQSFIHGKKHADDTYIGKSSDLAKEHWNSYMFGVYKSLGVEMSAVERLRDTYITQFINGFESVHIGIAKKMMYQFKVLSNDGEVDVSIFDVDTLTGFKPESKKTHEYYRAIHLMEKEFQGYKIHQRSYGNYHVEKSNLRY